MDAYWDSVIAPALAAVRPRTIVEIGSEHGFSTRKLLDYCAAHTPRNGVLTAVEDFMRESAHTLALVQLPDAIRELVLDDQRLRNDICWSVFDC